jgi:molecular chaperone DnaK
LAIQEKRLGPGVNVATSIRYLRSNRRKPAIGIDLGTTNSLAAIWANDRPMIIPNALGSSVTPSVVHFLTNGDVLVGEHALKSRLVDPENTITGIKRLIGRYYNEVVDIARDSPYPISMNDTDLAVILSRGHFYTPQQISGLILRSLKRDAEVYLGQPVNNAVITVPAYFDERQREATKQAAQLAGLNILRIVPEPVAAALADRWQNPPGDSESIAVFDLGGGTFDISILLVGGGVYEVVATGGDGFLGGDDFDSCVATWVKDTLLREKGIHIDGDAQTLQRVLSAVIDAKHDLAQRLEARLFVPYLRAHDHGYVDLDITLTRQTFDDLNEERFARLMLVCMSTLADAKMYHVDRVILVGGATRMTRLTTLVAEIFGVEPSRCVNPDEAVVIGAAMYAGVLSATLDDVVILDTTTRSYGLETADGRTLTMIERHTTYPTRKTVLCSTFDDDQRSVEIHVVEGENEFAVDNKSLLRLTLDDIKRRPGALPEIEVTMRIDTNGLLDVTAQDLSSDVSVETTVKIVTGMTDTDVADLLKTPLEIYPTKPHP